MSFLYKQQQSFVVWLAIPPLYHVVCLFGHLGDDLTMSHTELHLKKKRKICCKGYGNFLDYTPLLFRWF